MARKKWRHDDIIGRKWRENYIILPTDP